MLINAKQRNTVPNFLCLFFSVFFSNFKVKKRILQSANLYFNDFQSVDFHFLIYLIRNKIKMEKPSVAEILMNKPKESGGEIPVSKSTKKKTGLQEQSTKKTHESMKPPPLLKRTSLTSGKENELPPMVSTVGSTVTRESGPKRAPRQQPKLTFPQAIDDNLEDEEDDEEEEQQVYNILKKLKEAQSTVNDTKKR
jgi:hypothetical protein